MTRVPDGGGGVPGVTEFCEVLHAWAKRQLEQHSDHTGPFTIVNVQVSEDGPGTFESTTVEVDITFKHDLSACVCRSWDGSPCRITLWSPLAGTTETVKLINELLVIADRHQ